MCCTAGPAVAAAVPVLLAAAGAGAGVRSGGGVNVKGMVKGQKRRIYARACGRTLFNTRTTDTCR